MDQKVLDYCKKDLLGKKKTILENANKTLSSKVHEQTGGLPDTVDRSSLETDRSYSEKILDRERKFLKKVDEALERIEEGNFGICDSCEDDIEEKRIKVRPETTLCIECKEKQEKKEKLIK